MEKFNTTVYLSRFYCLVLIVVSLCMFTAPLVGQEITRKFAYKDQVLMNNGSRYVGEVLEITDEIVSIQLVSGGIVPLTRNDIKRIYQHLPSGGNYGENEPTFMDHHNRYFFGLDMGLNFSPVNSREYFGFEMGGSVKLKINTRHLIGLRNTLKFYSGAVGLTVNDIHVEYNYFLSKPRKVTPYTSVRIGTGFVLRNDEWSIRNKDISFGGGIGLGLIKSIGHRSAFFYEFSYNYQPYSYSYIRFWQGEATRKELFENVAVRIGYWF